MVRMTDLIDAFKRVSMGVSTVDDAQKIAEYFIAMSNYAMSFVPEERKDLRKPLEDVQMALREHVFGIRSSGYGNA